MARGSSLRGKLTAVLAVLAIVLLALWMTPMRQMSSAQDRPNGKPLIARGYTDAAPGTVVVSGDPAGGQTILQLKIKDGQRVKRDVRRNDVMLSDTSVVFGSPILQIFAFANDRWHFTKDGVQTAVELHGPLRTNAVSALRDSAVAGLGLALLPDWLVAPDVAAGRLKIVLSSYHTAPTVVSAVYRTELRGVRRVKAFIDHLAEAYAREAAVPR